MEGVRHLAIDYLLWEDIVKWHNEENISFFTKAFAGITSLTICFPSEGSPLTGQERISDHRFRYVGVEILETGAHALLTLQRASGPLKTSLVKMRRSFGDERCPETKIAVGVDEEEYKRLPEEERFTTLYTAPE